MISVIVPVYNSEKYIEDCLKSITKQTYTDLEIICVNDGSTDRSQYIIEELAKKDKRIKLVNKENEGVSSARNHGIEVANGDYITFVDSDDVIEADMYFVLYDLIKTYSADISHCGYKKIYKDGSEKNILGTEKLLIQSSQEATKCLINGNYFASGLCNKLYKKDLFSDIRLDEALKINEDVLANVFLFKKAEKIVFYDVPKYIYFDRGSSACNQTDLLKKKQDSANVAMRIFEIYKNTAISEDVAKKAQYALIDLYRQLLYSNAAKNDLKQVRIKIKAINNQIYEKSKKNLINFYCMSYFPFTYKLLYKIYDKIRTPNWDL